MREITNTQKWNVLFHHGFLRKDIKGKNKDDTTQKSKTLKRWYIRSLTLAECQTCISRILSKFVAKLLKYRILFKDILSFWELITEMPHFIKICRNEIYCLDSSLVCETYLSYRVAVLTQKHISPWDFPPLRV